MKATEAKLLDFLKKSPQFIVPIYQRDYAWGLGQCARLWEDILRAGKSEEIKAHFLGSIVYVEQGIYQVSSQASLLVIDGQQRLTTLFLLLEALARAVGDTEPVEGFSAEKIRSYYLQNRLEKGDKYYKLLLKAADRDTLCAIVKQEAPPEKPSPLLIQNFRFFEEKIKGLSGDFGALCRGLAKLIIVDIALSRDQDNPQLIFESLNSTGLDLTQADLIRNFLLMGLEPDRQQNLYLKYWWPMEQRLRNHFGAFMRHYLTLKTGRIPKTHEVYEAFKAYAHTQAVMQADTEALVTDIYRFAAYYCAMVLGEEADKELRAAFRDLRELKVDVVWPFLLELYEDYNKDILPHKHFLRAVRLVESYLFRRAVCNLPTNSLNKVFLALLHHWRKDRRIENLEAQFLLLRSSRRFPSNGEFEKAIKEHDLYTVRSRCKYLLRRLENHGRKEPVSVEEYTIEHILPQNENLSEAWREALGPDWKRIQQEWVHTLGNLTLTGYNSEYSDRPFPEKRDMHGGFRESPLRLNQGLAEVTVWNEEAIKARADRLAKLALEIWPKPNPPSQRSSGALY